MSGKAREIYIQNCVGTLFVSNRRSDDRFPVIQPSFKWSARRRSRDRNAIFRTLCVVRICDRPVATGVDSWAVPPNFLLHPENFSLKHTIKTKILPPNPKTCLQAWFASLLSVDCIRFSGTSTRVNFVCPGRKRDVNAPLCYRQGCCGAGTRGNDVPTSFSCFALKWVRSCFKMASFSGAFPHLFC